MSVTRTLNFNDILKNLDIEVEKITARLSKGLDKACKVVLEDAKDLCPVATGNLFHSGFYVVKTARTTKVYSTGRFVNPPGKPGFAGALRARKQRVLDYAKQQVATDTNITAIIGFSAPYALYVHEHDENRVGKTEGKSPSGKRYPDGTWADNGQWKFLETAVKRNAPRILEIIVKGAKY